MLWQTLAQVCCSPGEPGVAPAERDSVQHTGQVRVPVSGPGGECRLLPPGVQGRTVWPGAGPSSRQHQASRGTSLLIMETLDLYLNFKIDT
jgi:hypothetical protein